MEGEVQELYVRDMIIIEVHKGPEEIRRYEGLFRKEAL